MIRYKILFAEDIPDDMELAERELRKAGINFISKRVETKNDFITQLLEFQPDVIISDYSMPSFNGMDALEIVLKFSPFTPVIIHTGSINEETAVKCMKAGASDYILKDKILRLPFALREVYAKSISHRQHQQSQIALKTSEERYKGLFNSIDQGVLYVNKAGYITMINPAALRVFMLEGTSSSSIDDINKRWVFENEDGDSFSLNILSNLDLAKKVTNLVLNSLHLESGIRKWILLHVAPESGDGSKNSPDEALVIVEDITVRKESELALIQAKIKAEESDRLKSAFLANLSHEVRTPMNAILGFSELLADLEREDETEKYFINTIQNNSIKLLNIISDIVEISKIETEQITIYNSSFELSSLASHIDQLYKSVADCKGIAFTITGFDENVILNSDEQKIKKVLLNLVDNAIKFTDYGSINITCSLNEELLEFHVVDSGIGVLIENKNVIFERFRQADEGYSRRHGGTGLGLTIAKAYVEAIGGKIWLSSHTAGSDFGFTIPAKWTYKNNSSMKFRATPANELAELPDYSKYHIIVAEDDAINFAYLTKLLSPTGITVSHASNGCEVVELIDTVGHADLILMDIKMPIMDGYEATETIRKKNISVPIIATTAYAMSGDKEKCISAGCNAYISKPIKRKELFEMISRYLINGKVSGID